MLYASLVVAAVLMTLLIYRYDMYDKEQPGMLLLAVIAGAAGMFAIGWLEDMALDTFVAFPRPAASIAIVAASFEEVGRLAIVIGVAVAFPRHFNDPMDGLIYGSMIGLGMAVAESLSYMQIWSIPKDRLLPAAEIIRLFGHTVLSGITCFAIGMARMRMKKWPIMLFGCLSVSIGCHFLWDWIAFSAHSAGGQHLWQSLAAASIMLGAMLVYGALVVVGADWSRQIFSPHAPRQLWGWPIDVILARRQKVRWDREAAAQDASAAAPPDSTSTPPA